MGTLEIGWDLLISIVLCPLQYSLLINMQRVEGGSRSMALIRGQMKLRIHGY